MNGFGFDSMGNLIEADNQYGLFEDKDKLVKHYHKKTSTKSQSENKSF